MTKKLATLILAIAMSLCGQAYSCDPDQIADEARDYIEDIRDEVGDEVADELADSIEEEY